MSSAPRGYKIEDNDLHKRMLLLYGFYTEIGRGTYHSLLVIGPPGIGKSAGAREYLLVGGAKIIPLQNCYDNQIADELYKYRHARFVLFSDDNDHVWDSEPLMNKLKVVAEANGERLFVDLRKNGHSRFHVNCRFVFVTNKPVDDEKLMAFDPKMRPHIAALKSRFQLHSALSFNRLDCFHFSCWMATDGKNLLRDKSYFPPGAQSDHTLSIDESNEVLAWFAANFNRLKEVSVRTLIDQIADYRLKSPSVWTALAEQWCNADARLENGREVKNPDPWVIKRPVQIIKPTAAETVEAEASKVRDRVKEPPVEPPKSNLPMVVDPPKKTHAKTAKPAAKKTGRKPLTAEQRAAKNLKDRERRAAKGAK